MLKDAALVQLDLLLAALDQDLVLKDSTPYNVQFRGARPRVRGHGVVRASAGGRAVGGLPPVLHALPLPASAPVAEGRALPSLAARLHRRHHAGTDALAALLPRPLPPRALHQRLPPRPARGALRGPAAAGQGRGQARGPEEGDRDRERAQDAQAGRRASTGIRRRASGPPTASATATRTPTRSARTSSCARSRRSRRVGPRVGHGREQRPLLADRRRGGARPWWRWTPTRGRSSCCTATFARRATRRS